MVIDVSLDTPEMVGRWPRSIESRLSGHRGRVEYDLARRPEDVVEAWRLVYFTYLSAGFIRPNSNEIHVVPQVANTDSAVFVRKSHGLVSSTICLMTDGRRGLPLDQVYPDEFNALRRRGRRMVELGLFADQNGGMAPSSFSEFYGMFRLMFSYATMLGATDIVCGVHPRRARVLERFFGLRTFGEIRSYPFDNDQPVIPLRGNIKAVLRAPQHFKQMHRLINDPVDPRFYRGRANLNTDWTIEAAIHRATSAA